MNDMFWLYMFVSFWIVVFLVILISYVWYVSKLRDKAYREFKERHNFDEAFNRIEGKFKQ